MGNAEYMGLHRFFVIYGTLCMMRSVTVISTSLPDSSEKCRLATPTGNLPSGAFGWTDISIKTVLIRSFKLLVPSEITCGDMVFSGHTMLMVMCAMTWHTYYKWVPGSINYVKVTIWIITIFGLMIIIWVRMHYTLDVILALYFTITLWGSYHRFANDVNIGHRFSAVWIVDAFIIYPVIEYFESPVLSSPKSSKKCPRGRARSKQASGTPTKKRTPVPRVSSPSVLNRSSTSPAWKFAEELHNEGEREARKSPRKEGSPEPNRGRTGRSRSRSNRRQRSSAPSASASPARLRSRSQRRRKEQ